MLNNSVTVKGRATKFKIPQSILSEKGFVLFLALCDLCPGTKVAICDVNTIKKMPESDRSKKNGARHFVSKYHNSGNNGRNCTIFGAKGDLGCPFDFSYFDLGVIWCNIGINHTFADFDLGMIPCDLELVRGGGLQQEYHLASN